MGTVGLGLVVVGVFVGVVIHTCVDIDSDATIVGVCRLVTVI